MIHGFTRRTLAAVFAGLLAASTAATAARAEFDALKGQNIRFVIAAPAGGSTDRTGRKFAEIAGRLVEGATVRVQNLGEAGGGVGLAEVQNASGTAITFGMVNGGVVYAQLAGTAPGQFDLGKLKWLGAIGGNQKVLVIRKGLGPPTLDTLSKLGRQPIFAVSGGAGTPGYNEALLIDGMLPSLRIKVVGDLEDAQVSALLLAGNIDGTIRSYATMKPLIDSGDVLPVLLFTREGMPDALKALPTLGDVIPKGKFDPLVQMISGMTSRMFMASPATRPEHLAALRDLFERVIADPEFQATLAAEDRAVKRTAGPDLERQLGVYFGSGDFGALVARTTACGQKISGGDNSPCS